MSAPTTAAPTSAQVQPDRRGGLAPLPPAKQPTGAGPIGWVGPVLSLVPIALGAVLLRDAIASPDGRQGWVASVTRSLDGLAPARWMVVIGVVLVLLGIWLVVVALRPRTRRALALRPADGGSGASGIYLRPTDVARRASAAAQDVDGVLDASTSANRRTATVTVSTTASGLGVEQVAGQVRDAVTQALAPLARPPRVRVHTRAHSESDGGSA